MGNQNLKYQFFFYLKSRLLQSGWIILSAPGGGLRYPIAIQQIRVYKMYCAIYWIAIYPVHSVIQPLDNRGQDIPNWAYWKGREGSAKEHEATLQLVGGRGWHPVWEKCKYSQSLHFSDAGLTLTGFDHNTKQQEDNIVLFESGIEQ